MAGGCDIASHQHAADGPELFGVALRVLLDQSSQVSIQVVRTSYSKLVDL